MNADLQKHLMEQADSIIESIKQAASSGAQFASEQLPDIAYQYIAFSRVYYTSLEVFFTLLACAIVFLWYKMCKRDEWDEGMAFPVSFLGLILLALDGTFFLCAFKQFLMVWFVPKIYLITEIATLLK